MKLANTGTLDQVRRMLLGFSVGDAPEVPMEFCGSVEVKSNGNGSLIRILPIAIYLYNQCGKNLNEDSLGIIHEVSALTHAHERSQIGC